MGKEIPRRIAESGARFVRIRGKEKIPMDQEWQKKNNFHIEDPRLSEWVSSSGNVGVLTGNGLVIFDCDTKQAENIARQLPLTLVVGTSNNSDGHRKKHFYFKCNLNTKKVLKDHDNHLGEIQSKGQQCLIPPSVHPSGIAYEVLEDREIARIDEKELLNVISPFISGEASMGKTEPLKENEIIGKGSRNDRLFKLGSSLRSKGALFSEIQSALETLNKTRCFPPLTSIEIRKIVQSVSRYMPGQEKTFFKGKDFISKRLGDFILLRHDFKTLIGSKEMYYYKDGYYHSSGKEKLKQLCIETLGEKYSTKTWNETHNYVEGMTYVDPTEIEQGFLNLKNGILNPVTGEFIDHTPEIFSTIRIPIEYDKEATCPKWLEFLGDIVDEETISVIQEMFGYVYMPNQPLQKAFLLYGVRQSGKSTVLKILESLAGSENVLAFPLQYLTENEFAAAYLFQKLANICADITAKSLKDTGKFMTITGGDKISAGKKHQHNISFFPGTKLIFSCNTIPATNNKNLAFYRRWIILQFRKRVPEERINATLTEELKKELSGILNWALDGLRRLQEKKEFSYSFSTEDIKDLYERSSDSVQSFIYNNIDMEKDDGVVTKREIYKHYVEYCNANRLTPENQIYFGRVFKAYTGCGTGRDKDTGIPTYRGVFYKGRDVSSSSPQKTLF